jgi:hypothetical protein
VKKSNSGIAHLLLIVIVLIISITSIVFLILKGDGKSLPILETPDLAKSRKIEKIEWVKDSITQSLPPSASKTRLSLPAKLEDLMPDGAPIVGFGAHSGQHVEGLDHPWIAVKKGEPARALADGVVTNIGKIQGQPGREEYMIYIDYGGGLMCSFGEIDKPLVEKGQKVKYFDPVGEAAVFYGFDATELEIYCADANRSDGIGQSGDGYHTGAAVSPFDYLNEKDKKALETAYTEKILKPYQEGRGPTEAWSPADPYLTNKIMVHEENSIIGEWFLVNKKWNDNDYSLVIFLPSNKYYDKTDARLRIENANMSSSMYVDALYEVEYVGDLSKITINTKYETLYAIAQITENAGTDSNGDKKAQMKFEISKSPISTFSNKALTYQERGYYNPRYDAWKLGGWVNYQ